MYRKAFQNQQDQSLIDIDQSSRNKRFLAFEEEENQRRLADLALGDGTNLLEPEMDVEDNPEYIPELTTFDLEENNDQKMRLLKRRRDEEIDPLLQARLEREFEIYADHKLKLIEQGIDLIPNTKRRPPTKEEKKEAFIKKRDKFLKRMERSEHQFWGTDKYDRLLEKWFPDYTLVLENKVSEIKNTINDYIADFNQKIGDVIYSLAKAINLADSNADAALKLIQDVDKELIEATKSKDNAVMTLTGFPESETRDFLPKYDTVLDLYRELIATLRTNIGGNESDKIRFETATAQLSQQKALLDAFNFKIQQSSDVVELVSLQNTEFTDLIASTEKMIEEARNLEPTTGEPDEAAVRIQLETGKKTIEELNKELVKITGGVSSVYWGKGVYYNEEVDALYIVATDYSAAYHYTLTRKFDGFWFFVDSESGRTSGMQQKDAVEKYYLANPISPQELSYFLIYLQEIGVSKEIVKKIQERGYASEPFRIQVEKVQLVLWGKKPRVGFGLYTPVTREAVYEKVQYLIPEIDESPYKPLDVISDEDKKLVKKMSTPDANEVYKAYKANNTASTATSIPNDNNTDALAMSFATSDLLEKTAKKYGFDGAPDFWKHIDKLNALFQRRALQIANNMLDNTEILIRLELDSYKKNPERIEQLTKALAPAKEEYENYFYQKWEDERYVMTTGNSEMNDWASMGQRHAKNAESKVRNLGNDHPLVSYFSRSESKMDQLMGNLGLVYQPYGMPQYDFLQKKQVSDGNTNPYTNTTYSGLFEDPFNPAKNNDAPKSVNTSGVKLIINQGAQEMLQNIKKTREALKKSPRSVWKLDNVVALTQFDLGIDPEADTAARKIIDDQIWLMNFDPLDIFLTVINIGLGILAATGIGTAPALVLLAGLGAAGTSAIQFYRHYEDYEFMKAAAGTAPIPEASLSSITPDNSWLFWDMIGLGLDFFAALKIIGLLGKSVRLFKSGKLLKSKFLKEITENAPKVLGKTQAAEFIEGITKKLDDVDYIKQIQSANAIQLNKEVDDIFQNLSKILDGQGIKAMNGLKPEVFEAMTKLMKTLINKGVKSFDDFIDITKAQSKFRSSLGEIDLAKLSPDDLSRLEQKFGEELENLKILNQGTDVIGPSKVEIAQQDLRDSLRRLHIAANSALGVNRIPLAELVDVTAKAVKYGYFKLEEGILGLRKFLRSQGIDEAKIPDEDLQKVLDETSNVKPKENGNLGESSLKEKDVIKIGTINEYKVFDFKISDATPDQLAALDHAIKRHGQELSEIIGKPIAWTKKENLQTMLDNFNEAVSFLREKGSLRGQSWQPFAERGQNISSVSTKVDVYIYDHANGKTYYLYLRATDQKFVSAGLKTKEIKLI